jgi:hypothetical protein
MSKTNNETATLRPGKKPKASKIETAKSIGVVSLGNAEKQNLMDGKKGKGNLAQPVAGRENPSFTTSGN